MRQTTNLTMNQKRKRRGFFFRSKRSKKQSKKPQTCLRKQPRSCFSMHSHPAIFSIMCRCSYSVKREHPNKPVEAPTEPEVWHQNVASPREATLITKYDYSAKSEVSPSTPTKIKRGKLKKRVTIGSNQTSTVVGGDEAEWPPSSDEDYIVFCFEEDGEFRVVMEDSSRSSDILEHGNSDVSPTPHNLKVEEERFYFSPRLQSDGIRSSTRFKQEVEDEERSRGRVDEEKECKDMDDLKSRGPFDDDNDQQQEVESEEDVEFRDTSIECVHGSTESSGSIQSDWERLLDVDREIGISSPSAHAQDGQTSNEERDTTSPSCTKDSDFHVDDEESVYLSSESHQEESQDSDEHSNNDEQSGGGSAETSDGSRSEIIEEEQFENDEQLGGISIETSNTSRSEIIEEEQFEHGEQLGGISIETSNTSRSEIIEEEQFEHDEQLGGGSTETSDGSRSEIIEEEQFEDHEEPARFSVVSSKCSEDSDRISRSSFEFPALPWEWIGSPDIWPKSVKPTSISFRKQKSNKMCLRLCRF